VNRWLRLVRAPAALTVLGDTVAGAAAAGRPLRGRRALLPLSSVSLYWAGMALNDWADRELDAVERPERPIPSGQVDADQALAVAVGLTGVGLGLAAFAGGRDAVKVAVPLAAAVWAYDTVLKPTPAGPLGMAACRGLDVLLGAGASRTRAAASTAATVAGHAFGVTALSTDEVYGGTRRKTATVLAGTAAIAGAVVAGRSGSWRHRLAAALGSGGYLAMVGTAQWAAAADPTAVNVRKATANGIHGTIGLQAALAARHGAPVAACLVAAGWPLAKLLARKVSPT
jgi:4-hydroxybenzoate polyprenyltransferase